MVGPRALRIAVLAFVLAAVARVAAMYMRDPLFGVSGVILVRQVLMLVGVLIGLYANVWRIPSPLNRTFSALALAGVVYLIVDGWRLHLFRRDPAGLFIDIAAVAAIAFYIAGPFLKRVLDAVRRS